jgi:hypothetical protein
VLEILDNKNNSIKMSAGIKRIDTNFDVVYYTGKGLREMFKQNVTDIEPENADMLKQKSEEYLLQNDYMGKISFDSILRIV